MSKSTMLRILDACKATVRKYLQGLDYTLLLEELKPLMTSLMSLTSWKVLKALNGLQTPSIC